MLETSPQWYSTGVGLAGQIASGVQSQISAIASAAAATVRAAIAAAQAAASSGTASATASVQASSYSVRSSQPAQAANAAVPMAAAMAIAPQSVSDVLGAKYADDAAKSAATAVNAMSEASAPEIVGARSTSYEIVNEVNLNVTMKSDKDVDIKSVARKLVKEINAEQERAMRAKGIR